MCARERVVHTYGARMAVLGFIADGAGVDAIAAGNDAIAAGVDAIAAAVGDCVAAAVDAAADVDRFRVVELVFADGEQVEWVHAVH